MPKNNDAAQNVPETSAEAPLEDITLEEFCLRLSRTDKRVELIGGFFSAERRAGQIKAAESAFAERFQAFVNKPV